MKDSMGKLTPVSPVAGNKYRVIFANPQGMTQKAIYEVIFVGLGCVSLVGYNRVFGLDEVSFYPSDANPFRIEV